MPSHHHHHQSHQNSSSGCCCSCCCSSSSIPSPPPPASADQLLQALASHLLLLLQSSPQPPTAHNHPPPHPHYQYKESLTRHHTQTQTQTYFLLQSLLQRVSALESQLPHLSSHSSPPPPPRRPSPPPPPPPPAFSLRDLAARTIQARFRLFLVRRSQSLRHLQRLAVIKSHAAALRASLSDRTAPAAVSQKATDLLLQLDSIQSRDPMVREGKRSISRELARILEFIDKFSIKDQHVAIEAMEIAENGGERRRIPASSRSAKRVSFVKNVKESRFGMNSHEPFPEVSIGFADQRRGFGGDGIYGRVLEEDGEVAEVDSVSEEEESPKGSMENGVRSGMRGGLQGQNGKIDLSAPLPVYMEPIRRS